jgi:hypothetical protein
MRIGEIILAVAMIYFGRACQAKRPLLMSTVFIFGSRGY